MFHLFRKSEPSEAEQYKFLPGKIQELTMDIEKLKININYLELSVKKLNSKVYKLKDFKETEKEDLNTSDVLIPS